MKKDERIGEMIAYHRKRNAITQAQLAEAIGVSVQAVSKWERHISYPDIMVLPRLADLLGTSIDELFGHRMRDCASS